MADENLTLDGMSEDERKNAILAAFLVLESDTKKHLQTLTATLGKSGSDGLRQWFTDSYTTLLNSHTEAWALGRRFAGDTEPQGGDDTQAAGTIMSEQATFLAQFEREIGNLDSRYIDDEGKLKVTAVASRLLTYADRLFGTMAEASILAYTKIQADQGLNEPLWDWVVNDGVQHCEDCPLRAAGGPYTTENLPGYPGDGTTKCRNFCRCYLEAADGFMTPTFQLV